ncbi:biotin transporter BioY [candidate division KSB1 bacterium]|nr:biotin transporter BioY [candidate division KSB1 bacterium]
MKNDPTRETIYAGIFTALTVFGALIKIPFPLAPLTLQTLFTLLAGSILSPRYAALSQAVYLLLGLAGLPVFAQGGGISYILQPSFGFLLSLPFAAFFISLLNRKYNKMRSFLSFVWISLSAAAGILFIGSLWLFFAVNTFVGKPVSFENAMLSGLVIFLPGETAKSFVVSYLAVHFFKRYPEFNKV